MTTMNDLYGDAQALGEGGKQSCPCPVLPEGMVVVGIEFIKRIVSLTIAASDWSTHYGIEILNDQALKVNEEIFANECLAAALEEKP